MTKCGVVVVLVMVACSEKRSAGELPPSSGTTAAAGRIADEVAASPGAESRGSDRATRAAIDTSAWVSLAFDAMGKEKFSFRGTIKVPPGTKTETSGMYTTDKKRSGFLAYVDLPDGVRIMLAERSAVSQKDPALLKQLLAPTGRLILDRRDPAGYMLAIQRDDGIALQGANWKAEPGFDCATERTVTREQLEEVLTVCDSFSSK